MPKNNRKSTESDDIFRPVTVRNGEFVTLDSDVNELLARMKFNPFQKLVEVYDLAMQLGEVGAAVNCAKFLAGYVKPVAKQVDQKVVVQILHQGSNTETLSASGVQLADFVIPQVTDKSAEIITAEARVIDVRNNNATV